MKTPRVDSGRFHAPVTRGLDILPAAGESPPRGNSLYSETSSLKLPPR